MDENTANTKEITNIEEKTTDAEPANTAGKTNAAEFADTTGITNAANVADAAVKPNTAKKRKDRMKQRRRQVRFRLFLLVLFSAAFTAGAAMLIIRYTPTSKRMPYEEYFGQMKDNEAAIVFQDHILADTRAMISESGEVYLPHEFVRSSLNERFFWDEESASILFTTATQTFVIPAGSTECTVIDGTLETDPASEVSYDNAILLRDSDGSPCLSLDFLAQYTDITWLYDDSSRHVFIRNQFGPTPAAEAKKEAAVRFRGGIKSPIVADLKKGETAVVLQEESNWMKVLTDDGFIGWVKSSRMSQPYNMDLKNEGFSPPAYPSITMEEKVSLIWHMITTQSDNKAFADATAAMTGINVISPTWFSLVDNAGNVESLGSKAYVEEAHGKGLQVWGLLDDFSPDMDNSVMLSSTSARRNCISQLTGYATTLGLDGINLDFEHVDPGDAYTYTQFVRELSIVCRRNGMVLSVDTFPPYEFNAHLNRKEIAEVCDYLICMGYDEHYVGSDAGSVASLGFEEGAINNLLLMGIPAGKLISAIPFYTRIWYTSQDEGGTYVNSETLSMNSVSGTLESWNLTPEWDPVTSQNYVAWYTDEGVLCQIWIEDASSLQRKVLLISSNDLAGCAIWALGFQNDSIWPAISENLTLPREEAASLIDKLKEEAISQVMEEAKSQTEGETSFSGQAAG